MKGIAGMIAEGKGGEYVWYRVGASALRLRSGVEWGGVPIVIVRWFIP